MPSKRSSITYIRSMHLGEKILSPALFDSWSRKYSWRFILSIFVMALFSIVAGIILIIIGKPKYQAMLFEIGNILGVIGTAFFTIQAYWKEILEKINLIRMNHISGHVIICGLGDKGLKLMRIFTEERESGRKCTVVIIELIQDHPDIPSCRQRGVLVLTGDASDKVLLKEANVGRAKYLFAVTGDDNTNLEIARQGRKISKEEKKSLRCYVHITNSSLRDIMVHHDLFAKSPLDGFNASIFNIYDTASRVIMEKFPPDLYERKRKQTNDFIRIVIIGFGRMGESIVRQAARIGHYPEWKRLEVTVVDRNAQVLEEKFFAVYGDNKSPRSFIVSDICVNFIERDPECLTSLDEISVQDDSRPAIVYIAEDDDKICLTLALRIRNMLGTDDIPIVTCMQTSFSELMEGQGFSIISNRNIHSFNLINAACGYAALIEEVTDKLARTVHSSYVNNQMSFHDKEFIGQDAPTFLKEILRSCP